MKWDFLIETGSNQNFFFSFYLPKFLIDLFNISRPFPSRRDFSMDFWLIALAFICLSAVLMRFILRLFHIVSLGLVRKSVVLQMVVVLQGRFVQTATHSSLLALAWFTKPDHLRPFRSGKNTPQGSKQGVQPRTVQDMDFLKSRGFITETVRSSPSKFSPPNHTSQSATQLPLPTRTQNCCWLQSGAHTAEGHSTHTTHDTPLTTDGSVRQERGLPSQKRISGLQHMGKIRHYGIRFLFSTMATLFQQMMVLHQPYKRRQI